MADDVDLNTNCWKLENYLSLLFLDPRKEKCNGLGDYYKNSALDLFGGMTRNFLLFQYELDQGNIERDKRIEKLNLNDNQIKVLYQNLYIEDKIVDLEIISKWVERLKSEE